MISNAALTNLLINKNPWPDQHDLNISGSGNISHKVIVLVKETTTMRMEHDKH